MKPRITQRQKEILSIIYHYIKDTGYPPTIEEMREELGVVSNQSILDLLRHLVKKRFIERKEGVARSVVLLPAGYAVLGRPPLAPFLGLSHAGAPVDAVQIDGEWQAISQEVTKLVNQVYLIRISGDSMINAGIENGDVLLVKEQKEFISGEIVLAQVGSESTVKRFISEDKPPFLYLKPENPEHKIIYFSEEVELKGKVISILKNGQWRPIG